MNLRAELSELLAGDLRGRLTAFEPRVLSWLLLLPEWTEAEWPFGNDLIGQLDDSGLIERRDTLDVGDAFWVRDSVRPELARYVREVRGTELEGDLAELARSSWLGTLTPYRRDPSGRALMDAVEQLLGEGQVGEATRLTAAARLLGEAMNEPLADAARRARWRIDRAVRTAEDQRQLEHYIHRASVEAELATLRDPSGGYYGLHLLGGGGTGKTMVIRYLCGTSKTAVARIDFDHLDPRYPDQRPGEILLALAGELLGYSTTRKEYLGYRRLQDTVDALHEALASDVRVQEPTFAEMIRSFARFVELFPPPVLLVLDTCEELAKLYPPGTDAPAIDRTFQILDQVHDLVESVRFVLAGRRWLVRPPDEVAGAASPRLRRRPWVRVLPFTGFTRAEAEHYLRIRHVPSEAMTDALLQRAAADDGTFNPFELAAYCEWALSDPDLDPLDLQNAPGDPLVERRIIGRVTDRIRAAVPVAAAFGRFDLDLIAPALHRSGLDPPTVFNELTGQEWMNVLSVDSAGRPGVIEVDDHVRRRILDVITARHPVDMDALGRDAVAAIERAALPELPVETVESAVRLLPVAEAGVFWARLERRITEERAWGWAAQATMRAGAVESVRARGGGRTILAAILATQAAARIHTANTGDVIPLWREVGRYAPSHPDPLQPHKLQLRGLLGRLAAGDPEVDPDSITVMMDDDLAGSFAAAAQRMVADGRDASRLAHWITVIRPDQRIAAVAYSLLSVLALRQGNYEEARANADKAMARSAGKDLAYSDWAPPHRVVDRCRLARLFVAFVSGELLTALPWEVWRDEAIDHLGDIDAERLASLALRYERGYRALPQRVITRVDSAERYASRRPADWLHFQIRPLTVELAMAAWADQDQSFGRLQVRIEQAVAAGDDPDTVDACQLAKMRLYRRHRYADAQASALSRAATPMVRAEAWLVRKLVNGDGPKTVEDAGSWHGWWQCQSSPEPLPPPSTELGIPPDVIRADQAEYREHFALALSVGAAASRPSFDPEQVLRSGGSPEGMAPGERGRALLAVGEVLALRSPARAATLLVEAVESLARAGDETAAAQAAILATLATARADQARPLPGNWRPDRWAAAGLPTTWANRLAVAQHLYRGEPVPARLRTDDSAPELRLAGMPGEPVSVPADTAPTTPAQQSESAAGPGSAPWWEALELPSPPTTWEALTSREAQPPEPPSLPHRPKAAPSRSRLSLMTYIAVVSGVLAIFIFFSVSSGRRLASLSTPPRSGISFLDILWIVIAALALVVISAAVAIPHIGVYRRFSSPPMRGFQLTYPPSKVTVEGCRAPRIDGRAVARFLAWRPVWYSYVEATSPPPNPVPVLRIRKKRPTIISIAAGADYYDRPWEQWLGQSYPPSDRANLLYFRPIMLPSVSISRADWKLAAYNYQGPANILNISPFSKGNARALHLIGTPVSTRGGWRFRVSMAGTATTRSRGAEEGEALISPGSIKGTPQLVILQADPVDSGPQSLGEDRRGYVSLAGEFLGNGSIGVLIIPPLDDRLAAVVAEHLHAIVMGLSKPPRPTALLLLLSELKKRVLGAPQSAGGEDPTLDLLLLLRSPN